MRRCAQIFVSICLLVYCGRAQDLSVYSDLIVLAEREGADLGCEPVPEARGLEVLSPVLPLGGRLSLLLVVRAKAGTAFALDVGLNPANRTDLRLYRYFPGLKFGSSFFAHPLEEVQMPLRGRIAEGQRCAIFFLDVQAKAEGELERIKVEPAAWVERDQSDRQWSRYPMEVRLVAARGASAETLEECDAPLRDVAWQAFSANAKACRQVKNACRLTDELTVGAFLTRQYRNDFPVLESAPACEDPGPAQDLLRELSRARVRTAK